jgi:hypothetical protein
VRSSIPAGPALVFAIALRALERDEVQRASAAIEDAVSLDPLTARDDDARLDAAAVALVLALDRGDQVAAARAREVLGPAASSTGAYWRGEALRAWVDGQPRRGGALGPDRAGAAARGHRHGPDAAAHPGLITRSRR